MKLYQLFLIANIVYMARACEPVTAKKVANWWLIAAVVMSITEPFLERIMDWMWK